MTIPTALLSHCEPQRWKCPSQKSFTRHGSWVLVWAPCTRVCGGVGGRGGGSSPYSVSSSAPARHHPSTLTPAPIPPPLLVQELLPLGFDLGVG